MNNGFQLVENGANGEQKVYNSALIDPQNMDILKNALTLEIVSKMAGKRMCAMDVARELEQHEQKIYYHIRRLENAGIIKKVGTERRFGMTAKMYTTVSPVVSAKLYEGSFTSNKKSGIDGIRTSSILDPFIKDGELNAKIIVGDPYPHGKYDHGGLDGYHAAHLTAFLGNLVSKMPIPSCQIDTKVSKEDLKDNIIVIGGPVGNTITQELNKDLPIYFDERGGWCIVSNITGKKYYDDLAGVIIKMKNPFDLDKKVLLLAGKRTRGTMAAVMALAKRAEDVFKTNDDIVTRVVHGLDSDGDGLPDDAKFLE